MFYLEYVGIKLCPNSNCMYSFKYLWILWNSSELLVTGILLIFLDSVELSENLGIDWILPNSWHTWGHHGNIGISWNWKNLHAIKYIGFKWYYQELNPQAAPVNTDLLLNQVSSAGTSKRNDRRSDKWGRTEELVTQGIEGSLRLLTQAWWNCAQKASVTNSSFMQDNVIRTYLPGVP